MRRLARGSVVAVVLGAVALAGGIPTAGGQTGGGQPAPDNQIVVHVAFGNGTPGPDAAVEAAPSFTG
jgi:hypothetical protein